jgi:EAL domain-containing protein (putative c-di-GMP-specific phosphodiesterase class I)
MGWELMIRKALAERDGFSLAVHCQPIATVEGAIAQHEMLVRLNHPTMGVIPASWFIDAIADNDALMIDLDWWMLRHGIEAIARTETPHAVNLGLAILGTSYFAQDLGKQMATLNARSRLLHLEITERDYLDLDSSAGKTLTHLAESHTVVLDDLGGKGSRHSPFVCLSQPIFAAVKVDYVLTIQLIYNSRARAIVRAIAALCSELEATCTLEGVEDQGTWDWAKGLAEESDRPQVFVQGWAIGMPGECSKLGV